MLMQSRSCLGDIIHVTVIHCQTNTAWLIKDTEHKFKCTETNDVNYVKCTGVLHREI